VSIAVPPGFTNALQTNLMEDSDGPALPIENGKISFTIRPYQIVAIKVNYPAAAIHADHAQTEMGALPQ
jgi:alpha-mannosidase